MKITKTISLLTAVTLFGTAFTSCGGKNIKEPTPDSSPSTLAPVDILSTGNSYKGIAPTEEKTLDRFSSADGLCVIEKKSSYYDVTLDYSQGDYYKVGSAYAEAIKLAYPGYETFIEPYIYENIHEVFSEMTEDYSIIQERIDAVRDSLSENYLREMDGFAETLSGGSRGLVCDKKVSYDEACLIQMIPDILRGTACSSVTVSGDRTASGERISSRMLEWSLGSSNQICTGHCVVRFKNGSKSLTAVSLLGIFSMLTGVNDDGVLTGIHDVGSLYGAPFVVEGKTSYTYALRYALENFTSAREVGDYMVSCSNEFTWNANIFLSDKNYACCVELVVDEDSGEALVRDSETPLNEGLFWDDKDSLCVVNAFAAKGNSDGMTNEPSNIVRWEKYKQLFCSETGITQELFKEKLTREPIGSRYDTIRSKGVVLIVIVDYSDNTMQAVFTGTDGVVDKPEFISLGKFD